MFAVNILAKLMTVNKPMVSTFNDDDVNAVDESTVKSYPQIENVVPFAGTVHVDGMTNNTFAFDPGIVNTSETSGCKHHFKQSDNGMGGNCGSENDAIPGGMDVTVIIERV